MPINKGPLVGILQGLTGELESRQKKGACPVTDDEASAIRYKIDVEGFDYCFRYYSHFEEIEDPEFHRLRKAYAEAAEALDGYIPDPELDDEEDEDEGTGEEDEGSEEVEF